MQREVDNLEFVQSVNFEFLSSLRNNGTKYLLIFHDSCEEILIAKAPVEYDTAGRHCGLSSIF